MVGGRLQSLLEWQTLRIERPFDYEEEFNTVWIERNNITIHQKLTKPNPCTQINYTVVKEDYTIHIYGNKINKGDGKSMCVSAVGRDFLEINLTLSKGEYILLFEDEYNHTRWDYDPTNLIKLNKTIIVE